ncbi:MAG: alanine--glyoxylate aminotransferase family protein [Firmicutes bacterium]|nr:alanine--glyoxylate aminotransferase family protein [Bacillota bacterium]
MVPSLPRRRPVNLRIPGPTPCPPEVLQAMSTAMINHRGPEFAALSARVTERLKYFFQTQSDVLIFTAAGTGALEVAVVNTISPGDKVLAVSIGVFGDRFANIAKRYGAKVTKLDFEWGKAADPDAIRRALAADPAIKAVLVTHNETSTGVTNPLEAIAAVVRSSEALLLVDAVSSLAAVDLRADAWRLDVVVAGSQKALMGPPGAVFLSVSDRAWEASRTARMPRWYFSWDRARAEITSGKALMPFTPPLPVIHALQASVQMILAQGLPARFAHHRRLGQAAREGVAAMGLRLFADPRHASDTVTAVRVPDGVDARELVRRLRTDHGVVVAGGQGRLEGRIIRIGHMGYVQEAQVDAVLRGLAEVLPALGHPVPGAGPTAGLEGA